MKEISGKNDPILILRAINITMRKIFAIDDLDNLTIDEFTLEFYNGWDDQILTKLKEIKEISFDGPGKCMV